LELHFPPEFIEIQEDEPRKEKRKLQNSSQERKHDFF